MKLNNRDWLSHLISWEEKLMRIIVCHLSQCADSSSELNEEEISLVLVDRINRDPIYVELFYPAQDEATAKRQINGKLERIGRIDIKVILDRSPESYFAIEAKKISANGKSDVKSYIADGLIRFVTEKYAAEMPIGCMLGYVIGVDINEKLKDIQHMLENTAELRKLKKRIKVSKDGMQVTKSVNLSTAEVDGLNSRTENLKAIGKSKRFISKHNRKKGDKIFITHTLVDMS